MDRGYYADALREHGYKPENMCPKCKLSYHSPKDCPERTYKVQSPNYDKWQKIVDNITDELEPARRRESLQKERHEEWDAEDHEIAERERRRRQERMKKRAEEQERHIDEERRVQRDIKDAMSSPIGSPVSSDNEAGSHQGQESSSQAKRRTARRVRFSLPKRHGSRS